MKPVLPAQPVLTPQQRAAIVEALAQAVVAELRATGVIPGGQVKEPAGGRAA